MATKKKEMGIVKIEQSSINKVKKHIIGKKTTIGEVYKKAADKFLDKPKTKPSTHQPIKH